jgi:hypothetical protein
MNGRRRRNERECARARLADRTAIVAVHRRWRRAWLIGLRANDDARTQQRAEFYRRMARITWRRHWRNRKG